MSKQYTIRSAEEGDIPLLAPDVRQPDVEELWASSHLTPYEALKMSFLVSRDTCFVGLVDGAPFCMFGVRTPTLLSNVAVPWMIATKDIELCSRGFLRASKEIVRLWSDQFSLMQNYVDARNTVSIRWLQWIGFSVYYPKPYGVDKLPFHRFEMRSS